MLEVAADAYCGIQNIQLVSSNSHGWNSLQSGLLLQAIQAVRRGDRSAAGMWSYFRALLWFDIGEDGHSRMFQVARVMSMRLSLEEAT
jgi:hypothetical protein